MAITAAGGVASRRRAGRSPEAPIFHGTIGTVDRPELARARQSRLKHLIGLAPATFGSPMAHKGRSWLGAMFKGGKQPGPDFMEADLVASRHDENKWDAFIQFDARVGSREVRFIHPYTTTLIEFG